MVFLRKLLGGFIFLVVTIPSAWMALLMNDGSPLTYIGVSVVTYLIAAALWKDRPKPQPEPDAGSINDQAEVATVQFDSRYMPAGYEELGIEQRLAAYEPTDCLGRAAELGKASAEAMELGQRDLVWRLVHMQKVLYMQHAAKNGFTRAQTLALDGRMHQVTAKVLRDERKHKEALIDILYWASSFDRISRAIEKTVKAYANRADIPSLKDREVISFLKAGLQRRELSDIRDQVAHWDRSARLAG